MHNSEPGIHLRRGGEVMEGQILRCPQYIITQREHARGVGNTMAIAIMSGDNSS